MTEYAIAIESPPITRGIIAASGAKNKSPTIRIETIIPDITVTPSAGVKASWTSCESTVEPVTYVVDSVEMLELLTSLLKLPIIFESGWEEKLNRTIIVSLFAFTKFFVSDLDRTRG